MLAGNKRGKEDNWATSVYTTSWTRAGRFTETDNWIWIWFTELTLAVGLIARGVAEGQEDPDDASVFGVDRNNTVRFCLVHCRITTCFRHYADKLPQTAANFFFLSCAEL